MIYQGNSIQVKALDGGLTELVFDRQDESVNKFDMATLQELKDATTAITAANAKGVLVSSGKDVFIVGADITEFLGMFAGSEEEIIAGNMAANAIFNAFEDLPCPTVAAINGICLGGGFEMALACDYRVMSDHARVGLPETKLGLFPGFGGTVRLSRLIGADNAIEWIAGGADQRPDAAMKVGAVDSVADHAEVNSLALALLQRVVDGELAYLPRREEKKGKLQLNAIESMMVFETAKGFVAGKAGKNYPSPVEAIKTIQKHAGFERDKALAIEAKGFAKMAKTSVAQNLIGLFLNDQAIKKIAKSHAKKSRDVQLAAVLGAGIMGGGIAALLAGDGTQPGAAW